MHETNVADGITAVLFAAVVGAGLALFLKGVMEARNYDPVAEAQSYARRALGIE